MAAPETQFGQAGITIPAFTPVETKLNAPIQLPGTGDLWAQVGKTAMAASQMIQNSALNPAVRAQMQEEVARHQVGLAAAQHALKNKRWLYATTGLGAGGPTLTAPITQPVAQQNAQNIDWNKEDGGAGGGGGGGQQPTITRTGSNTGIDQNGNEYHETTPGSNQWIAGRITANPSPNLSSGMAQGGLVRGYATGGSVGSSDSTDHEALLRRMEQEHRAVLGAPPGTFLNPATGSYEPLQQPAAPTTPSPGMFGARTAAPAPAAPAPSTQQPAQPSGQPSQMTLGATAQPPPGMELAGTEQAFQQPDQASMATWQAQNAHPVMASSDALSWMKNLDTGAQRATYLPHGGPNGEPAYAFHMKGGGINTVPISQIVKNGGGPLVAGQNTSATLSTSDAIMNQQPQQQQQQQPQGMTLGATAQAPPGMQLGQAPGQPPAAPQGPYPTIASDQGGAQGQPPPAPGTAYNAAAYQMPQGPTITQTGEVNPALMAGGTDEQAAAAARDAAKAKASPEQLEADANSANPIYDWRTEIGADGKPHTFTTLPDPEGRPFVTQRYFKGSLSGFQTGTWTTDNRQKEEIYDEMVGTKGVPIPKDENGNPIKMDAQAIALFNPEQQRIWLKYIRDYNLHPNAPLATSPEGQGLVNAANAVKDAQRIKDKILYLQQNNIPMSTISQPEIIRSQEAGYAKGEPGLVGLAWHVLARGAPQNNYVDELNGDYKQLNNHLAHVPGGTYEHTAATPKPEDWGIPATDWTPAMGFPKTTNVSTIPALNRIGSGDNYQQALAHIQEVLDNATSDYKQQVNKLGPANYRVPDVDAKNLSDLADRNKGYIDDSTNKMWDEKHQKMVNPYGPIPYLDTSGLWGMWRTAREGESGKTAAPTSSATPSQTPTLSGQALKTFMEQHKGEKLPFFYPDPDHPGKTILYHS